MKCGLMYQFSTGGSFDNGAVASVYAEQLDQIALVDELGFDDLWLSEHHFTESNYLPSPMVMAGAVAMRTRHINVGIGIAAVPSTTRCASPRTAPSPTTSATGG